jgi:hypothetical protein
MPPYQHKRVPQSAIRLANQAVVNPCYQVSSFRMTRRGERKERTQGQRAS